MRPGTVRWIGVRPGRREPVQAALQVRLDPAQGIVGDRYKGRPGGTRQVTLIQQEHLAAIGSFLGLGPIDPARLRRNIVVSGINLLALRQRRIRIGDAVLEGTGECHPCSRMEEILGIGGYNAVRGHGGITARVLVGGEVRLDDPVECLDDEGPGPDATAPGL